MKKKIKEMNRKYFKWKFIRIFVVRRLFEKFRKKFQRKFQKKFRKKFREKFRKKFRKRFKLKEWMKDAKKKKLKRIVVKIIYQYMNMNIIIYVMFNHIMINHMIIISYWYQISENIQISRIERIFNHCERQNHQRFFLYS